jgi:predicted negative regulator of RcsB-dependent stress response
MLKSAPLPEDPALAEIQRLRLARLQLMGGKADDALATLASIADPLYPAQVGELRGDIHVARGKPEEAQKAYEQAMTSLDEATPMRRLVELKLIEAGGKPPARPEA